MRIVVDQYPDNCETCKFKTDNFSSRKNHCTLLHMDIGGADDVRFSHICHKEFVTFDELLNGMKVDTNEKENKTVEETVEEYAEIIREKNKDIDEFGGKKFKDIVDDFVKLGKDNIDKYGEGKIIVDSILIRDEEEIKRQREEALSKAGFLDTGNTVSIGEELRKIKDDVLKMDRNYNGSSSETEAKKSEPTDYSKMQADEMRCEAFGGLV